MTSDQARTPDMPNLPHFIVWYELIFYTPDNMEVKRRSVFAEHSTAYHAVVRFDDVVMPEEGLNLRMEISVHTDCLFYLERVAVIDYCTTESKWSLSQTVMMIVIFHPS